MPTISPIRYNNPKNPNHKAFSSFLTGMEAAQLIRKHGQGNDFAMSLLSAYPNFSVTQMYWFFKIAEDFNNPQKREGAEVGAGMKKLHQMMIGAARKLKRPKVRLEYKLDNLEISLAGANSKNAGYLYVKVNGEYAGKISPDGKFYHTASCPDFVQPFLEVFGDDTAKIAGAYGRRTGNCCFCALTLTDARSLRVGYGPICAANYGLPHEANE